MPKSLEIITPITIIITSTHLFSVCILLSLLFFFLFVIRISVLSQLLSITLPPVPWYIFFHDFNVHNRHPNIEEQDVLSPSYAIHLGVFCRVCLFSLDTKSKPFSCHGRGSTEYGRISCQKLKKSLLVGRGFLAVFVRDLHAWVSRTRSRLRCESAFNLQGLFQSLLLELAELSETGLPNVSSALIKEIKPIQLAKYLQVVECY